MHEYLESDLSTSTVATRTGSVTSSRVDVTSSSFLAFFFNYASSDVGKGVALGNDREARLIYDSFKLIASRAPSRVRTVFNAVVPDNRNFAEQYSDRMSILREVAPDEDLEFNEKSANRFFEFLQEAPYPIRRAAIGLGIDGEINAVWVSKGGESRLSIEFYTNGEIKYAWLPPDSSIEIERVSRPLFWSNFREKLRDFLT